MSFSNIETGRVTLGLTPRLTYGIPEELQHYQLLHDSIHWPDLDEDIGLPTLL